MNHLLSLRTNILYAKKKKKAEIDPDEYTRYQELIFLVDKPSYKMTNDGEVIRERGVDELRFTVSEKAFDEMMKILLKLKGAEENELT